MQRQLHIVRFHRHHRRRREPLPFTSRVIGERPFEFFRAARGPSHGAQNRLLRLPWW